MDARRGFRGSRAVACLLLATAGPLGAGDVLRPLNTATNEIGALVDGVKGTVAVNDERYTEPELGGFFNALFPTIPLADFTADTGSNEVIGFARRRPARLVENVPWTAANNSIEVPFEDEYLIPVHVWIVQGPFASVSASAADAAVTTSLTWAEERLGVAFSSFSIIDATGDPDAGSFLAFHCTDDGAAIQQLIGHDPGVVNVYYVNTVDFGSGPSTGNGVWCSGEQIIAMGKFTSDQLLAHELGHAFNLAHTNTGTPPGYFDSSNVMHSFSSNRRYLTEGQTLRAVFHSMSALNNIYDVRSGELTRDCGHTVSEANAPCPPIQKRIWSDGLAWPPN